MDAAAAAAKTAEWANISGKPLLMGLQPLSFTYTSPDSIFDDDGIAGNLVLPFPYFVAVGGKLQYSVTFGGIVSRQLTIKILDHGGNVITTFSKTGTGGSTYSGSGTFTKSGLASQIVVSVDKLGYPADKIVFTSSTGVYNLSVI